MHTHDPGFTRSNFSAETLAAMHVDLVWIVDADGKDVYSTFLDRHTNNTLTPAPPSILDHFRRLQTKDRTLRERSPADRTVHTARGIAAASTVEISRSNYSGPTGAFMMFGRYIEPADIARVQEASHLPVQLFLLDESPPTVALPSPVRVWALRGRPATYIMASSGDSITGYALIRDVDRHPVALFATTGSHDIVAPGSRTTWYLLSCIVALFVVCGALAVGLLLRMLALQERDNKKNLNRQAERDLLTGLPNRTYLQARLPRLLEALARVRQAASGCRTPIACSSVCTRCCSSYGR
jgi:sensor domain CHASE-containing protein